MTAITFCLFVYFKGGGGRGCSSQPKVHGNDRNDSFGRKAGAHSRPRLLSGFLCENYDEVFILAKHE